MADSKPSRSTSRRNTRAVSKKFSSTKVIQLIAGQVVARMDTEAARSATAQRRSQGQGSSGQSTYRASAEVAAKQAEFNYSDKQYKRSKGLVVRGAVSEQEADVDRSHMETTRAALLGAQAQAVRTQSRNRCGDRGRGADQGPKSKIACSRHQSEDGFQHRLAEPGEVLPGRWQRCLRWFDLSDVYMYLFLPEPVGREGGARC